MHQHKRPLTLSNPKDIIRVLTQGSAPKTSTVRFQTIAEVEHYLTTVDKHCATIIQKNLSNKWQCDEIFALLQEIELRYSIVAMAQMLANLPVAPELEAKLVVPCYPPQETNETLESRYRRNLKPYLWL